MSELLGTFLAFFTFLESQLGGFFLELSHALKFPQRGHACQDPSEFGMPNDVGLNEHAGFFGIQSASDVLGEAFERVAPKFSGHAWYRDGMHVDDAEIALVIALHPRPVSHGAKIVSQGQSTSGLGAS